MAHWYFVSVFIMLLLRLFHSSSASSLLGCPEGTYQSTSEISSKADCKPCPKGTYMSDKDHSHTECFPCTEVENDTLEILIARCNSTRNSVIHCETGYYRKIPFNQQEKEKCEKCTECEKLSEILPCSTQKDTHCCPGPHYDVLPDKRGVPGCFERPWFCRKGTYLDQSNNDCVPCPNGTFMSQDYHTRTECVPCLKTSEKHLPKHSVVIHSCNDTHNAVVECRDGFHINASMGHYEDDIGCYSCTNCSESDEHEGRKCMHIHDTVCCTQPNMTVIDTIAGPECRDPRILSDVPTPTPTTSSAPAIPVCGQNKYLYFDNSNGKRATCIPCPCGTFMDESHHTEIACKKCTEFEGQEPAPGCHLPETAPERVGFVASILVALIIGLLVGTLLVGILCLVYNDKIRNHPWIRHLRHTTDAEGSNLEEVLTRNGANPDNIAMNAMAEDQEDHGNTNEENKGLLHHAMNAPAEDQEERGTTNEKRKRLLPHGNTNPKTVSGKTRLQKCECDLNPGHDQFIPMKEFGLHCLPKSWRHRLVVDYIKATADLTVLLSCNIISKLRPGHENAPNGYYGSGMVHRVIRKFTEQDGATCPCDTCKTFPFTAKTQWGEVEVVTKKTLVYNDDEVKSSSV